MATSKHEERHIVATVRSQHDHRDEVRSLLLELIDPARAEPGCLYYDLYESRGEPGVFYIVDGWASDAAARRVSPQYAWPR